jgi:hypothetical protein
VLAPSPREKSLAACATVFMPGTTKTCEQINRRERTERREDKG